MRIEGTNKTPDVRYDKVNNKLVIKGLSITENGQEFFNPLIDWIEHHLKTNDRLFTLEINLEYYNTMSNLSLLSIFKLFINRDDAKILWLYDEFDEEIGDAGNDFNDILGDSTNFEVRAISNE